MHKLRAFERWPRAVVVVLAPDKFAGSLAAPAVCASMASGLRRVWPDADIRSCPMADGGEGTLDAVLASVGARGTRRVRTVRGAGGRPTAAAYGVLDAGDGPTAIVEVAQIVGIADPVGRAVAVSARSTRGVGELLGALMDEGVRRFLVALGGSSTNDAGAGMLEALGAVFRDSHGTAIEPVPAALGRIERVDVAGLDRRLERCDVTLLTDVDAPLCGPRGATAVFGPRKGVASEDIATFDEVLSRFAGHVESVLGRHVATASGAGAAGGLGFALQALGATYRSGAEAVADLVGLDAALQGADWIITGEGRSDAQTLAGKAPLVVARLGRGAGIPVTLISGALDTDVLPDLGLHFAGCFAIPPGPITAASSMADAGVLLADRVQQVARVWEAARVRP
jgi:glycerate kinase